MTPDIPDTPAPFAALSPAAHQVWAKHERSSDTSLPLWRHLADSAATAGQLWERWVPRGVVKLVATALPGAEDDALRLVRFLGAAHDVGKATPAFACQVEPLASLMRDVGLDMLLLKEYGQDRKLAPHGLAGQLLLQEWLSERFGLGNRIAGQFAVVAGGHHGVPPDHQQIHDLQLRPYLLRHPGASEAAWHRVQYELMDGCAELAGVAERLPEWRGVRLPQPAQVALTAVVILADWIASSPELFPYDPETWRPEGPVGERRRFRAAWEGLALPGPWAPEDPPGSPAELFVRRFPQLAEAEIRPVQSASVQLARTMPTPGLVVIEAPMGEGKTEAALAAAEILAARAGAGGVLIALPTRATSDAMFSRVTAWLNRLPGAEEEKAPRSVVLAHAKAALNDEWAGLLAQGQRTIAAVDLDGGESIASAAHRPAGLHAHQWLRGRKKQLLASFAVTTIDQVLFAGLKSRHLALRHLAVAGKVVIIDEVHAYDAYMGRYLDRVLEWLAAYRVPVVLLSATLPAARRKALIAAYCGGSDDGSPDSGTAYPLLTAAAPGHTAITATPPAASGRRTDVRIERIDDDLAILADRLDGELADGGCALVVRNTVDRVLEAADALRAQLGADAVTVAHSRFLAADRATKDAAMLRMFGPDGAERPHRHVVVASQVLEQSLDVDFDFLVTDAAPVDLVLQRMGRLHRHVRPRPARLARPRCLITGVDWGAEPPKPVPGTLAVYRSAYTLLRTLAVLGPFLDGEALVLPDGISPLVQAVYGDEPVCPGSWADQMGEARVEHDRLLGQKRERAESFLLSPVRRPGRPVYGWLNAHAGDADDSPAGRAQVRDTAETLEVLVVQQQADRRLTTVPWLDDGAEGGRGGLELPVDFPPSRRAAEAVAASALTLPGRFSTQWTIGELERFLVPAWQVKECPWLAGELILVLDADCQTRLSGFLLTYSRTDGLRVTAPGMPTEGRARPEDTTREAAERGSPNGRRIRGLIETRDTVDAPLPAGEREQEPEAAMSVRPPSFDLVSSPWLPVQHVEGTVEEVSLLGLFEEAHRLRRLVGDIPTQELALLRLLLAILYDTLEGPAELEAWEDLWLADDPFSAVASYLKRHRDRFDLFHPDDPFYQVADLRTAKDELAPLSRIVADVPVGEPFFAMRRPGVDQLSYAEAARWLVHAHAYDTSGIKSAMVGDTRGKAGKVYPLGVGSLGDLGGIFAEGDTLRETLLLNLIAFEEAYHGRAAPSADDDRPVWRRPRVGAEERDDASGGPRGLRDLYTWQSRRVRLHARDGVVTGVILGYGDRLAMSSPRTLEPMSSWRRSPTQEKKQKRPLVYMPQRHDPSKAAWRGLASLLPARQQASDMARRGEAAETLRSGITDWITQVITNGEILPSKLVRLRLIGAKYGTQQSVIDEIADDSVVLPVITLHEKDPIYGAAALDAVSEADRAVTALGQLAANLARAAGTDPAAPNDTARDLGFGALDGPYRAWLKDLLTFPDLHTARQEWRSTVRRHMTRLGRQLLRSAGPAADEGRLVDIPKLGVRLLDAGRAESWFRARLDKVLGPPVAGTPAPRSPESRAATDIRTEATP
ncbi:type I-E CRISPR-associated protein Cse1/CasA [Streptomyces sp. AN091965]|uniref:type I-E CRISPR-associated protein Cse1/CasA n=1 Tax=Streptomyces sp. AN091965 TaxID=2927803 RepID=UPI001F619F05|nr:type I-E CRISPR-associated protein Cse1/CasA [Streptomyces sp. AN091965]MCI3930525.1 type I-E CRISPR-associated protein Cse1/CasA [Streptomyces sp. AN091965]